MTPVEIKTEHQKRLENLTRKKNENDLLKRQISDNLTKIQGCADKLMVVREALKFLEEIANSRRGTMKGKIEEIVTEALRLIYGTDYRVELNYCVKNNRSSLEIEMVRDTPKGEVRRQLGGFGGGVADTISVPLRLMVLLGSKQSEKICVLDECYKHMDEERIEGVAEFLKTLADRLQMQIIMCTHHEEIRDRADRTFLVSEKTGKSEVKAV